MEGKKPKLGFLLRTYWDKFLNLFVSPDDISKVGEQGTYPPVNAPVLGVRTVEDNSGIFWETEKLELSSDDELIQENDMHEISSIVLEEKENINTIVDVFADYDKMLHECADLIRKYDFYASRVESEEGKTLVSDISQQLIDVMLRCGGTAIMEDTSFDMIRHSPVPATIVENGAPIVSTLRAGVMVANKVYVPALVQIKK